MIPLILLAATLKIHFATGTSEMRLEDYVAAVVAGESGQFRSDEALKAMAVAARTYAIRMRGRHSADGYDLCANTHCQVVETRGVNERIRKAVEATAGEMLWFEGQPAYAFYSQDCGGRSEDGSIFQISPVPYLRPHADPYCRRASPISWQWLADVNQLRAALEHAGLKTPSKLDRVTILNRTASGRAATVSLSGGGESVSLAATALRFAIGREFGWRNFRSDRWDVSGGEGRFLFQGSGSGHGAGLCQFGADQMGVEGHKYRQILAHYFPGLTVGITARGISWTRIGGERVALMTVNPTRDSPILSAAERIARTLGLAPTVEVRVYPDIDSFRNATGEPGTVAGFTQGRRIHLQPQTAARTVRHELLHVMVEDRATVETPLWFREGLVCYLEGVPANKSYEPHRRRVAALVKQHGEATVMGWLKQGLPSAVN